MGGTVVAIDVDAKKITIKQDSVKKQKKVTLTVAKDAMKDLQGLKAGDAVNIWVSGKDRYQDHKGFLRIRFENFFSSQKIIPSSMDEKEKASPQDAFSFIMVSKEIRRRCIIPQFYAPWSARHGRGARCAHPHMGIRKIPSSFAMILRLLQAVLFGRIFMWWLKMKDGPATFAGNGAQFWIRVHHPGIFNPFQERQIGDAVGVKGAFLELSPEIMGQFFRPKDLSLPKAQRRHIIAREHPSADLQPGGQHMGHPQVSSQGVDGIGHGIGNDGHDLPRLPMSPDRSPSPPGK